MGKVFAVAMLIIGTIVGAGFVSGREIVAFFGANASPWIAVLCAVLIFGLSVLFLFIGSRLNSKNVSEVNLKLAGRFHIITDAFLLVNNLIILAGMLAAMDSLGASIIPFTPLFSIVFGILSVVVVCFGIKAVIRCNKIASPIMIVALAFVGIFTVVSVSGGEAVTAVGNIGMVFVYVCMNMMLASTVITTLGRMKMKSIIASSAIAAGLMGGLIFILMMALNSWGTITGDMPTLEMARAIHPAVYWIMVIVVAVSIFTTMIIALSGLVSWFTPLLGSKIFAAITLLIAAFILSNLGFANVVRFLYPVIGVFGIIYVVLGIIYAGRTLPVFGFLSKRRKGKEKVKENKLV